MTEIRVARHGSYAKGESLANNDGIPQKARNMKLPGFMDYVRFIFPFKTFALRDLKDALRRLLLAL